MLARNDGALEPRFDPCRTVHERIVERRRQTFEYKLYILRGYSLAQISVRRRQKEKIVRYLYQRLPHARTIGYNVGNIVNYAVFRAEHNVEIIKPEIGVYEHYSAA